MDKAKKPVSITKDDFLKVLKRVSKKKNPKKPPNNA